MTLKIFKILDRKNIMSDLSNLEILFSTQNPINGKDGKLYMVYKGRSTILFDSQKNSIDTELFTANG
jgi:hypothetical protein